MSCLGLLLGCASPPPEPEHPSPGSSPGPEATPEVTVAEAGSGARPNVLLITIDDLNDWIGPLGGHPDAVTPSLDRLAAAGVVFTHAYCDAPACNPSRTAMLTGLRPSTTGIYRNDQPFLPTLAAAVTLPEHFAAHGYKVLGAGKVFHSWGQGKEVWSRYRNKGADPEPAMRPSNGLRGEPPHFDWGPLEVPDSEMSDFASARWAAQRLAKAHKRPFFLALGLYRPHLPWYVPREHFEAIPDEGLTLPEAAEQDLEDLPPAGRRRIQPAKHRKLLEAGQRKKAVRAYLASIHFADSLLGPVLDALETGPNAENTLVVVTSDHGYHLGEKLHWSKYTLWEESTRVPLIVVLPGGRRAGSRSSATVNLVDLYPTLIELCGLSPRRGLDGLSLAPVLQDPAAAWQRPALTTLERGDHALRSERWRYIRYADGGEELYDHESDPGEQRNLADNPDFQEVKRRLAEWLPVRDAANAPFEGR